jgi:hypothetical protein
MVWRGAVAADRDLPTHVLGIIRALETSPPGIFRDQILNA